MSVVCMHSWDLAEGDLIVEVLELLDWGGLGVGRCRRAGRSG